MSLPKIDKNWCHFSCVLTKETHGILKAICDTQRLSRSEGIEMIVKYYVQSGKEAPKRN